MTVPLRLLVIVIVLASSACSSTTQGQPSSAQSSAAQASAVQSSPAQSGGETPSGPTTSYVDPGTHPTNPPAAFYDLGGSVPDGPPGDILRSIELAGSSDIRAWAVLYRSTGMDGKPVAVSGIVAAPTAAPPPGGYPIFTWAHGTVGIADQCAPSRLPPDGGIDGQWLPFVSAGFVVTASDYEGLGTPGVHPYGVGLSEGRSVLDIARAARHIDATHAGTIVAIGGHSEGGHGALWAGTIAAEYAPDLHVAAVLASAPGGDLLASVGELVKHPEAPPDANLQLLVRAWQLYYHLPVDTIMTPDQAALLPDADTKCRGDLPGVKVTAAFATDPHWLPRFEANSPAGKHIAAPILYLQGTADEQLPIAAARAGRDALCRAGDVVEYREFEGADHNAPLFDHLKDAVKWVVDTLAGRQPKNSC